MAVCVYGQLYGAAPMQYQQQQQQQQHQQQQQQPQQAGEQYSAPSPYSFYYDISAPTNGDIKNQKESSDGSAVTGSYSVVQPDGK